MKVNGRSCASASSAGVIGEPASNRVTSAATSTIGRPRPEHSATEPASKPSVSSIMALDVSRPGSSVTKSPLQKLSRDALPEQDAAKCVHEGRPGFVKFSPKST